MTDGMSPNARIFVNGKGERFMNEEVYLVHNKVYLKSIKHPLIRQLLD